MTETETSAMFVDTGRRAAFAGKRAVYLGLVTALLIGGLFPSVTYLSLLRFSVCSGMVTLAVLVFVATKLSIRTPISRLHLWMRRVTAVRWDCPQCSKRLESDVPWICGSCDRENATSSFLHKCGHCEAVPKAFTCYHCGTLIFFFQNDRDTRCVARRVPGPILGETLEDMEGRHRREIGERRHTIARMEADMAIQSLEAKMKPAEKVEPKVARESWMREQVEGLGFTVGAVIETIGEKKRLMERIDADMSLSEDEKMELASLVNHHCDNLSDDIRFGVRCTPSSQTNAH